MFEGPIASVRHRLEVALKSAAVGVAALSATVVAVGFFCAAAFLWLEALKGPIIASLILGGAFAVLALIALVAIVLLRRRKPPPAALPPWWSDPALLAAALDATRGLGRRRPVAVAVLVTAFVAGILLNRPPRRRTDRAPP